LIAVGRWLGIAFFSILLASLALLLLRVWIGPVKGLISARSTLNVAAVAFLCFCGCLVKPVLQQGNPPVSLSFRGRALAIAGVLLATVAAFVPSLWFPFLFDDYVHLLFVSTESWRTLIERVLIHHPTGGDMFFRPLGDLTFQLVYQWSGFDFRRWHITGLAIHTANTLLVLLLSRRMSGGWLGGCAGALFFGWQAAHVEAVSWVSALYDLVATLFVLLALLEVTGERKRYPAAAAFSALACLSKESAYCLPLLAGLSAILVAREARRISWWKTLWVATACTLVFLYRYWYLGGIGGYRTASAGSLAVHFQWLSALQAVGLRLWAVLFVPVNWSVPPDPALRLGFVFLFVGVLGFAACANLRPRRLALIGAFTTCAALPAISLLLIGSDLAGARILYLPSVGAALLWASIAASVPNRKTAVGLCSLVALFQLTALEHNEAIWGSVARTARQACVDAGAILRDDPRRTLFALDLPRTRNGVYFLQNAFPACVAINGDVDASRVAVGNSVPSPLGPNDVVVVWNDGLGRLLTQSRQP
jgi:hypothetical protein